MAMIMKAGSGKRCVETRHGQSCSTPLRRGGRRHLQAQRRHAVHCAQDQAERIQALHTAGSRESECRLMLHRALPVLTMIRLPKFDATMAPPPTAKAMT